MYQTPVPVPVRRRWPVVVALAAGLIVGGGGVGLGWALSSSSPDNADAAQACELVARTDSLDPSTQLASYDRWGAAMQLARAAADADPKYKPLSEALDKPAQIVARTFEASGPQYEAAMAAARAACAGI
ncbi:hypothetical protein FPZ12_037300 [Amycolatopsis acidicola]|uniref:Uncharacterized protein n=1 Tax=Amycolatopsis acidicola TaxID=2596893 RepID=A0A5N0UNP1_9PSEU|nr:hypothetical protein [Amycolatopsis acidicola]KAA9152232.1 hypothetical protein FPZ12_037300 [Amycolatopsis acidicola]